MPSKCCCANPGAVPLSELGIQMSEEQEVIITCPSQLTILSESLLEPKNVCVANGTHRTCRSNRKLEAFEVHLAGELYHHNVQRDSLQP